MWAGRHEQQESGTTPKAAGEGADDYGQRSKVWLPSLGMAIRPYDLQQVTGL